MILYTIKGNLNSNADALSRIKINALETLDNESIINHPGDVNDNVLEMLREITYEPFQPIPNTSNQNKSKIKILSNI